jgi:hypothetical protein
VVSGELPDAQRVAVVADDRQQVGDLAMHVGLAHAQLNAPVEHLHQWHRVDLPAIDAAHRHRPASPHRLDRRVQGVEPVQGGPVGPFAATESGRSPVIFCPASTSLLLRGWAYSPRWHIQQCPQEMLNGMTTRSPARR